MKNQELIQENYKIFEKKMKEMFTFTKELSLQEEWKKEFCIGKNNFQKVLEVLVETLDAQRWTKDNKLSKRQVNTIIEYLGQIYDYKEYKNEREDLIKGKKLCMKQNEEIENLDYNYDFEIYQTIGKNRYNKQQQTKQIQHYPRDYEIQLLENHEDVFNSLQQRYEKFYNKYLKFCKKVECNRIIDKLNQLETIYIIVRVVITADHLRSGDKTQVMLEYQNSNGFDYIIGNFTNVKNYFLFSNQMLILQGNFLLKTFNVENIINNNQFSISQSPVVQKQQKYPLTNIMVVNGPFYQSDIDFLQLTSILKDQVKKLSIQTLIIKGPIISSRRIIKGDKDDYEKIILNFFEQFQDFPIKVFYCHDVDEINNHYKLPLNHLQLPGVQVTMLPCPCILEIDGLKIGLASSNLIDEVFQYSIFSGNKFNLAFDSLLETKNLHPIYKDDGNVQLSCYDQMNYEGELDVLMANSKLSSFIKKIDNTVIFNCQSFIKENRLFQFAVIKRNDKNQLYGEIMKNIQFNYILKLFQFQLVPISQFNNGYLIIQLRILQQVFRRFLLQNFGSFCGQQEGEGRN